MDTVLELDKRILHWLLDTGLGHRHLSGQTPSVELAAIGRRVSETEWDVLDLLEGGGPK